jgi:hypothetical protein
MKFVSTKEQDYLDQDPPIRGQKYCCLSFISPEDVIKNKEAYFFEKFLKSFSCEMQDLFEKSMETYKENTDFVNGLKAIREKYVPLFEPDKINDEFTFYKGLQADTLESEYLEKNDFQTTIRGLKIRGSYETIKEAQIRCEVLKRMDDRFNVFIAEVGCWCPWSPNPEELENQEYSETQLNTLVKGYMENQKQKDQFFMERKNHMATKAKEEGQTGEEEGITVEEVTEKVEEDIWMKRKEEGKTDVSVEEPAVPQQETSTEIEEPNASVAEENEV